MIIVSLLILMGLVVQWVISDFHSLNKTHIEQTVDSNKLEKYHANLGTDKRGSIYILLNCYNEADNGLYGIIVKMMIL